MATNFPTSLDSLTNPTSGNTLANPSHSSQHADANDAIEALQAKVGVNNSAVTSSVDYKLGQVAQGNFADTNLTVQPTETTLATVTSRTLNNINYGSADASYLYRDTNGVWLESPTVAFENAVANLPSGALLTFGTWMSTNGQPVTATFVSYNSQMKRINVSNVSANGNLWVDSTGQPNPWLTLGTTVVVTNNSSLAITQPYFEIGNSVYETSKATISSGTITLRGDVVSQIAVGNAVKQKLYSSTAALRSYNFATGSYDSTSVESLHRNCALAQTVVFATSGTFQKANYPKAKFFRVIAVGGGGGSGGVTATGASTVSLSSGAGAGGVAIAWFRPSQLDSSVTVTVGAAGLAGSAGNNAGTNGGTSTFSAVSGGSTYVSGGFGSGTSGSAAVTPPIVREGGNSAGGGVVGNVYLTEYVTAGSHPGGPSFALGLTQLVIGSGGGDTYGRNPNPVCLAINGAFAYGRRGISFSHSSSGAGYGGGGAGVGMSSNRGTSIAGDNGLPGVVIVEVYE